jgi:hypothetical protein
MKRLTQREASVFVLDEFGHELGLRFRRGGGAALDADEYAEFVAVLRALAVHDAVTAVATAMAHDRRVRRTGGGREGAPSRDWLRNELRDLREVLTNVRGFDERRSARTIAMLLSLYGLDTHAVWWTSRGTPPLGAARTRWLVKRIVDLLDDGAGQYATRTRRKT